MSAPCWIKDNPKGGRNAFQTLVRVTADQKDKMMKRDLCKSDFRNRIPGTLGYGFIALTWTILGLLKIGSGPDLLESVVASAFFYPVCALVLFSAAFFMRYVKVPKLDGVNFLAMGTVFLSMWWGHHTAMTRGPESLENYLGCFALGWAGCFCFLGIFFLHFEPGPKGLMLLFFSLGALATAVSGWTVWPLAERASGGLFTLSALASLLTAGTEAGKSFMSKTSSRQKTKLLPSWQPGFFKPLK